MRPYDNHDILSPNGSNSKGGRSALAALAFEEHGYTWEQVLRVLRKNLRFELLLALSLTGLILAYAWFEKDFYKPTARLEIAPPGSGIKTLHEIESATEAADNQDYLETQVQILGSDALAVSVIRELHLDRKPEFGGDGEVKVPSATKAAEAVPGPVPSEFSILEDELDLANLTPAESVALEHFHRSLSVSSVRSTRLIEITFSSHDPQLAKLITNTLVTKFIDQNYRHRYTTTMQASEWLSSQLSDLRRKVEESAQAVADYQKRFGLVEVDDRDVPMSQWMNEMNRQLSEAQAARIEEEAFVRMIDQGHGDAVPALRDDKLYQDLMTHYADLRTQLAQAKVVYGDANVNVQKLQDEIAEVSVQIDAERKRTLGRTRSIYAAAQHREQLMMEEREKLRAKMGHMTSQLASYHMLKNEANANAQLYNTLQGRLREAGIYAGLRSSNIRVVDLATSLRKPTGPHRAVIVALGGLASCIFAVVLSFVRESLRNTLRTPDDIRSWIGLPSLALLPSIRRAASAGSLETGTSRGIDPRLMLEGKRKSPSVLIMKSPTAESEAMRDLRTALLCAKQEDLPREILISSSMEGEGKTTVAVNFAIALAQLGRTCIVDADLRQPAVARAFNIIEPIGGLSDVLKESLPLGNALFYFPEHENLAVLPSGTIPENPADLLSSSQMVTLLNTLKQQFRYIVIDSPPVIRFSDARFLSSLVDEVVLIGRCGVTTRRAMRRTLELLDEVRASVAGVVLNGIDFSSPDYNYYTYGYTGRGGKGPEGSPGSSSRVKELDDRKKPGAMGAHA